MADNGGEFSNEEYKDLCEQYNIEIQSSAAESPFSNGMVERHHKVLTEMLVKTKADISCSWDIALAWALNAKNSMAMFGGYSAYQLAFGRNPTLPNTIVNKLPAMDTSSVSKVVADNVSAMHKAREEFVACESSQKLKRALKSQVRTCNDEYFDNGEKVFYKRNNSNAWHGPGTVIGREAQSILVKHGNQYIKVHPCHITRATKNDQSDSSQNQVAAQKSAQTHNYLEINEYNPQVEENSSNNSSTQQRQEGMQTQRNGSSGSQSHSTVSKALPKVKAYVKFLPKHPEDGNNRVWEKAYVHSRAGKATGKYKDFLNIQCDGETEIKCVDWRDVATEWEEDVPTEREEEVLLSSIVLYDQSVIDAKQAELEKFKANAVYDEVENEGQSTIGVRWVVTKKTSSGEVKARLVALGYQEQSEEIRKDSPTCNKDTIRIVITLVLAYHWKIQHIDVQAAFLQGKKIVRNVFIIPPKEAETNKLWKLNKCIYGLVDGPRMWYEELRDTLIGLKMDVSSYDDSFLFLHNGKNELSGVIAVHVDDLMFSGDEHFQTTVILALKRKFKISTEVETDFTYTDLRISQSTSGITVSQVSYIDQMTEIEIDSNHKHMNKHPINETERRMLRTACGQMLWTATQSRPDAAYTTCASSNAIAYGTVADLKVVNKTMKYLKKNPLQLRYWKLDLSQIVLVICCDASFANLPDGSSQGGHIIFLVSATGKCCPMTWQSKKLRRVCKSTLAAESWAMVEAVESAEFIMAQLSEVLKVRSLKMVCLTDCKSLFDAIHTTNNVQDRGLRISIACLRQRVNQQEMIVHWIGTKHQLADSLTKAGASSVFLRDILRTGMFPDDLCKLVF